MLAALLVAMLGISGVAGCASVQTDTDPAAADSAATTGTTETTEATAETPADGAAEAATDDAETVDAAEAADRSIPAVGDEMHGFHVTELTDYPEHDATIVSMDHESSGAQLLWIANDDPSKGFTAFLHTLSGTDQGIPHIFEHLTLSGSEKYPYADLYNLITTGSYATGLNGVTYQYYTGYYANSLSDDELIQIMDFYMAGIAAPLGLEDQNVLRREAWRYELESADDALIATGAVLNEMEMRNAGIDMYAFRQAMKFLYPDSLSCSYTTGYRDDILTVTLDELETFHDTYYTPSNMLIVLYGDMDYERYLETLDENWLSQYGGQEVLLEEDSYIPWTGYREAVVSYPATEEESTEDASVVHYGIALRDISRYDMGLLDEGIYYLGTESSPLMQAVREAFPNASFTCYIEYDYPTPVLLCTLTGCNAGDGTRLREVVDAAIDEICETGLDQEALQSMISREQFSNALNGENRGDCADLVDYFATYWAISGDPLAYMDIVEAERNCAAEMADGTIDDLIRQYVQDPAQSILLEVNPEPGQREIVDTRYEQRLAVYQASLSEEETEALIAETEAYYAWVEEQNEKAVEGMSGFIDLDLEALEDNQQDLVIADETIADSVRMLSNEVEDAVYLSSAIYLDADAIPFDEVLDMVYLSAVLGKMGTTDHSSEELSALIQQNMYSLGFSIQIRYDKGGDGTPHPYLRVASMSPAEDVQAMYDTIQEILDETAFTDADYLRYIASYAAAIIASSLNSEPDKTAQVVAQAAVDENDRYSYYISTFDLMEHLEEIAAMDDEAILAEGERLRQILDELLHQPGMVYTAIGSAEAIEAGREAVGTWAATLDNTETEAVDYAEDLADLAFADRLAVTIPGSVNYNGILARSEDIGLHGAGNDLVAMLALRTGLWYPQFREKYGAYSFKAQTDEDVTLICSYADPQIRQSYDYYDAMPASIADLSLTEEDIRSAVLMVFAKYSQPRSQRSAAELEMEYILENQDVTYADHTRQILDEVRGTTIEDVTGMAENIQRLVDKGVRFTAGSTTEINRNKDLFDLVITDLTQ